MKIQLSERTKELLKILTNYSSRTKYTWVLLNILSLILLSSIINEKFGGTKPRIAVRYWNSNIDSIENLKNKRNKTQNILTINDSINDSIGKLVKQKLIRIDSNELNKLRGQQLIEFESIKIPVIGVSISSRDTSFFAALALLVIYLWYLLAIVKERSVLAQLLYPLIAKTSDAQSQKLWGKKNKNNKIDKKKLKKTIKCYKREIFHMRETISSRFLTLYSNSKKRWFEFLTTSFLTFVPLFLLVLSLGTDVYWDYLKPFKETGQGFVSEIKDYEQRLEKIKISLENDGYDANVITQLKISTNQLKNYRYVILFKRSLTGLIIVILASICVYDLQVARSMTMILTDMNENPKILRVKEFIDV